MLRVLLLLPLMVILLLIRHKLSNPSFKKDNVIFNQEKSIMKNKKIKKKNARTKNIKHKSSRKEI